MKKKLLTILLSIAVVLTSTVSVFATELGDSPALSEVLNTVSGGFPTTEATGWTNEKRKTAYVGYVSANDYYLFLGEEFDIKITNVLTRTTDGYQYIDDGVTTKFIMNNNVLTSIVVTGNSSSLDSNGTYEVAPTPINEVSFEYTDFNFFDFSSAPLLPTVPDGAKYKVDNDKNTYQIGLIKGENFVYEYDNRNGYWIDKNNEDVRCDNPDISKIDKAFINFDLVATGNNTFAENTVKVIANKKGTSISKELGVAEGLFVEGFNFGYKKIECNILFEPIKISDILPDDFPKTEESGWVNESGWKVYVANNDCIHLAYNEKLSNYVQKDGNNYKYSNGTINYTFIITSGVLTGIKIEGAIAFPNANPNGEFSPYKYVNDPISKPVGYTGDLLFVTNAHYNNNPDTVKVYIKLQGQSEELLDTEYYILEQGSTKVTLKGNDYVCTLPVGTHSIKIHVDGYDDIVQDFTITAAPTPTPDPTPQYKVPKTGVK